MAGHGVAVADVNRGCAFHSKHVRSSSKRLLGSLDEIERWLGRLADAASSPLVLIPTSDIFIEFVSDRYQRLAADFRLPTAYAGLASNLLDKYRFHELCQLSGVATPGVWAADHTASLMTLADDIPFPCLLKPTLIHRARDYLNGKKVLIARSRDEYVEQVTAMPDGIGGWLVQEIIPGPESAITLFGGCIDSSGQPRQVFSARKLRQYPPGFGSASLVSSQCCEETEKKTLEFLKEIDFHGICGAEFKRDPRDGVLKIIEINPRPTLWFQISHDSGKRIVEALLADLTDRAPPREEPQENVVSWRYALKDAFSALFYLRNQGEFVLPKPDIRPISKTRKRSWPVFSFDDPRPALVEPLGYVRKLWSRLS